MSSILERNVGRPWTEEEGNLHTVPLLASSHLFPDKLLIEAVKVHGEKDNWKIVALSVPGRTNKACRKVLRPLDYRSDQILIYDSALAPLAFPYGQEDSLDA